jgi:hypothetical protein
MPLKDRADVRLAIHIDLRGGAGDQNPSKEKNSCESGRSEHNEAFASSVSAFGSAGVTHCQKTSP